MIPYSNTDLYFVTYIVSKFIEQTNERDIIEGILENIVDNDDLSAQRIT